MNSLSIRLVKATLFRHGFFAGDSTPIARHSDREIMATTPQQGLKAAACLAKQQFMEVNATKTKYTFFGTKNMNPLDFFYNDTPVAMELATVPSRSWRPKQDTLRTFYLALMQTKAMHGIRIWCWGTSLTSRSAPYAWKHGAYEKIAGTPKGSRTDDALPEARIKLRSALVPIRRLTYRPLCEIRRGAVRDRTKAAYSTARPARQPYTTTMAQHPEPHIEDRVPPPTPFTPQWAFQAPFRTPPKGATADNLKGAKPQASTRPIARRFCRKGSAPPMR
ncbi:Tbingi protein [Trypanosoma grayi]|uniref:Tbingi protein n=1 Tax=Trypanosoma grayi TaxID=71804 RepID=UPI0004F4A056|nr:Tbingi protein [Trypanosoma grayi]KEG07634.1 Tbingi protein [Trypanosoma grayi]